jgi:aspartate aminotransferase
VARSRRLHRAATLAAHDRIVSAAVSCRRPSGGFYLYPDFEHLRPALEEQGVDGAEALADHLLERYDIGVLSGAAFGDDPGALRCRMATSLLYGDTIERRRQALSAEDPTALPWIRESLDRLGDALGALAQ